jgi:ABC-type Fe3+ transport system substrate-binding protein
MDYTLSNSFATDAGTAQRMHLQAQAIPTAVSDVDMNQLTWELMEIQKAGGQVAAAFDKAVPATYQKLLTALRSAGVFATPPVADNTTKAATTAHVQANMLAGIGQSWQVLTGSRAVGTTYTNSTGRPIAISVGCTPSGAIGFYSLTVNSVAASSSNFTIGQATSIYAIVPNGATYSFNKGGGDTTTNLTWSELR